MVRRFGNDGFSLTEVLIAAGILTVGFVLIAGSFPVGIKLTAVATERTIGAVAADEAFAKIQLYGFRSDPSSWPLLNPSDPNTACVDYAYVAPSGFWFRINEFAYPSTDTGEGKKYYWSAVCRHIVKTGNVQVTVFASRTMGTNANYPYWNEALPGWDTVNYPRPVLVRANVQPIPGEPVQELYIIEDDGSPNNNLAPAEYIGEGAILVDAVSGQIMRVLERDGVQVKLADWVNINKFSGWLWVIPPSVPYVEDPPAAQPPVVTGRYPCVGVYQRVLVR